MMYIEQEVNRILVQAESSGLTLRQLYELNKKHTRKFSLSFICRRSGIPSKGYLAFVMTGERRLNSKYWDAVSQVFKLNDDQSEILQLLLERDAEPTKRSFYDARIAAHRERLL